MLDRPSLTFSDHAGFATSLTGQVMVVFIYIFVYKVHTWSSFGRPAIRL